MNQQLTSLIITSRIGFFIHNPINRDPERIDWILQGITPGHRNKILRGLHNITIAPIFYCSIRDYDKAIEQFLTAIGFIKNPEWKREYPFNFTWYDEEQDIIYGHCALPPANFVREDVEIINQSRDFMLLSEALSLDEYLERMKNKYERSENLRHSSQKLLRLCR